jgi:phosphocarrier protein
MSDWIMGSVLITHAVGLHARPSVKLTKLAKGFDATIEIAGTPDGPWVDAKSIVRVMAMKAKRDTVLFARARGADAMAAIAALVSLIERDFDEDPAHAASG